jgi:hypothetical protein
VTPKKEREAEAHLAKMRQEAEALHAKMRTMTPEELLECAAMLVMTPMRTRAMLATMTPDELREGVAMLTEMHAAYSDAGHKQLEAENGQLTVKLTRLETQIKRLEIEEENVIKQHEEFAKRLPDEDNFRGDPELHAAFLEDREAIAEMRVLRPGRIKLGRPSIWRNHEGLLFVTFVNLIRRGKSCSTVQAIRYAMEHVSGLENLLQGVSDAALQVRYQEALKYWASRDTVFAQRNASFDRVLAAHQRLSAACDRVRSPKDFP